MPRGNAAGLVRVGNLGAKVIFVTSSVAASTAQMTEAAGFKSWTFQIDGTFTGASVEIDGTIDAATAAGTANNWFKLTPGSSGGVNPMVLTTDYMQYGNPLMAVRANVTALTTGTVTVLGFAVP